MRFAKTFLWAAVFLSPLIFIQTAFGATVDDYTPEVTARVARISLIRGEVQIRRGGDKQDWERAALNLPLVEGDEITTDKDARIEIQFDKNNFLRLAENSYLKITTLRDEGVALSLPQGTLSLRILSFDKAKNYFEIDAPSTTISVEKAGMFRIDAGDSTSSEMRVTATEGGEARVYSQNSGFTIRNGRSAKLFLTGNFAGEWETGDAERFADEFDSWVLERDAIIAKRLRDAGYDKFYDSDVYGAEDLNEYGEWINTNKYGWVWKPYNSSVSSYSNWSPYRYGHWRWIPVYGWTWVNDEPWGWATYHHGRWIWDGGYWVWTPYANYRWRRSWWRPAMVAIVTWNGSVCWYPLSYYDNYYDYNSYYYRRRNVRVYNNTTIINNNTTVIVNPTPTPSPSSTPSGNPQPSQANIDRGTRNMTPPFQRIPPNGVISVNEKEFGRQTKGYTTPPLATTKEILTKIPDETRTPPILPDYKDLDGKVSKEIKVETPRQTKSDEVKTGVTERKPGVSTGEDLRRQKIFGNRQPVQPKPNDQEVKGGIIANPNNEEPRKTGAVNRPVVKQENNDTQQTPDYNPNNPRSTGGSNQNNSDQNERKPVYRPKERDETQTPPVYVPPQPKPQEERRPQPRVVPQPQPKQEKPREQPRPQPQPKNEPKNEPQPEKKPSPSVNQRKSEKDS